MEAKQQGERIKQNYQVISVFPFVHGVLYYTLYDSFDPEETPTRFVHAIQLEPLPDEDMILRLSLRNESIFVPLQEVFIEEGVLYQVFEKMEGNLLGIYLYQNSPLAMGEVSQITQTITDHLIECESRGEFALVDPQNMVVETNGEVRFLYGGPLTVFPQGKVSNDAELSKQLGELLFLMLTGNKLEDHKGEMRPLRSLRLDIPVELESWIMKSISPDPSKRPPLHELWKWAHSHGGKKPDKITEEEVVDRKLDQFGVKSMELIKSKSVDKKHKKKLPSWVTWVAIGVIAIIFLLRWMTSGPDVQPLVEAKIIQNMDQDENKALTLYNQSVKAYESNDLDKALTLGKQALGSNVEKKEYYIHLANLYGLKRDYKSGVTTLTTATNFFTEDAKLFDQLAVFDYYLRDYTNAKVAIDKALALTDSIASIHYHRGKIYNALKEANTAIASMRSAVLKDPKNPVYFHDLSLIELQANNIDEAITSEKKAIQLDNQNIDYRMLLGILYLKQRDELLKNQSLRPEVKKKQLKEILNLAYEQFEKINGLDNENAEAYYYKARTYYINGKENPKSYADAAIATQKAITRDPDNALYSYQLGVCYMAVKNKLAAIDAFKKATSQDPGNRLYQNGLISAQALK
jgi:tetratricopeptide (TPR) repeat protein